MILFLVIYFCKSKTQRLTKNGAVWIFRIDICTGKHQLQHTGNVNYKN
jgi:hypothetical protein